MRPGASRLTAALEGLNASGQDGHIIARAESGPSARRAAHLDSAPPPHAADVARLVAHAKRLNKPTAEMVCCLSYPSSLCCHVSAVWQLVVGIMVHDSGAGARSCQGWRLSRRNIKRKGKRLSCTSWTFEGLATVMVKVAWWCRRACLGGWRQACAASTSAARARSASSRAAPHAASPMPLMPLSILISPLTPMQVPQPSRHQSLVVYLDLKPL